jgi:hypothetical protein
VADAVVFPGGTSAPPGPLIWYAGEVAGRRDATVHRHTVAVHEFLDAIGWLSS